jgi:DNA-binding response OmpR family regulator
MTPPAQCLILSPDAATNAGLASVAPVQNIEPLAVHTLDAALAALERTTPLLMLVDGQLPNSDTEKFIRTCKNNPVLTDVPIVVLVAAPSSAPWIRLFHAGADDCLHLPLEAAAIASKVSAAQAALRRPIALRGEEVGKHILLLDVDAVFLDLLGTRLGRLGYKVSQAHTPLEVLQSFHLSAPPPHACLLNVDVLGSTGGDLLERLRTERPDLPVILVSAVPSQKVAGASSGTVLNKNTALQTLVAALSDRLFRGKTRQAPRAHHVSICDFKAHNAQSWMSGLLFDLSPFGAGVRTLTPGVMGELLTLRLYLPEEPLELEATVAWSNEFNPRDAYAYPYGMGVQFEEGDSRTERVRRWLAQGTPGSSP